MHKYLPQLSQKEAKELELRNTLNSLEADMQMHTQEVHNLKREKQILEAQIHIANNEKKLHIEEHALQHQKWEQEFKQLHAKLNSERMQFKHEITLIMAQLNKLQQEVTRAKIQKQQKAEVYKQKLDMKDTEIYKKISEKEEIIKVGYIQKLEKSLDDQSDIHNDLRTRLRVFQEDTKLIPKKPSKPVRRKSTKKAPKLESSKSSQIIVPRLHTSLMSQPLTERGQGDTLDELSYIIVSLEKEQATLQSKLAAISQEISFDKERRKLEGMYEKNSDRLEAATAMQQDLIKERIYNERVMY